MICIKYNVVLYYINVRIKFKKWPICTVNALKLSLKKYFSVSKEKKIFFYVYKCMSDFTHIWMYYTSFLVLMTRF